MTDSDILVGDVCIDLVERGKVQVLEMAADTVEEHEAFNSYKVSDYKANGLLDVHSDEPVFTCVYLPENPSTSYNKTYDLPRSRLARCPIEEVNSDFDRIQDHWTMRVLAELFQHAENDDDLAEIAQDAVGDSVVDEAREFADALEATEVDVDVE